ncbi:uncharacterized protein TEOVI_000679400 [Trypanosoma equiperdum]|uniref:Uncharacterized protein n=1 Tax=Trypanosoma equiperdum TaxID=5694 RepID=A0A1G4I713_TRYEQ|nr:hypothetical protein, conserved [Trypanosoma equiperdum]
MLHEIYAPRDVASIAWSRRKLSDFQKLVNKIREGFVPPGPILLYGPSGCGKLSSVLAIFQQPQPQTPGGGGSSSRCSFSRARVLHSCDASPWEYHQFLMGVLSEHGGANNNVVVDSDKSVTAKALQRGEGSDGFCAAVPHVVKFYGEAPTSLLHSVTLRFLNYYNAYRHETSLCGNSVGAVKDGNLLTLRRHILVLIFTTHDTHNEKVALGKLLPSSILNHPCLHMFYCPPVTERSLITCIKRVFNTEQLQRRKQGETPPPPLNDEEIKLLAEQCHGDIRHALLQTQWLLLNTNDHIAGEEQKVQKAPQKRRRSPRVGAQALRSMEDLLADDFEESNTSGSMVKPPSTAKGDNMNGDNENSNSSKSLSQENEGLSVSRDDYLDVSHAAARVLTQKYTMESVVQLLNVEPDKLLGYLTNNMLPYFLPEHMEPCALTAAAASYSDALRVSAVNYRFIRSNHGLFTTSLTGDNENEGTGPTDIRLISLLLFGKAYTVYHKNVYVPSVFGGKRAPPHLAFAYPRLRELQFARGRYKFRNDELEMNEHDSERDGEKKFALFSSEEEWRRDFLHRLELQLSNGENQIGPVVDVLRETLPPLLDRCNSLDSLILEYAPYARRIVLNHSSSPSESPIRTCNANVSSPSRCIGGTTPPPELKSAGALSRPKRTLFMVGQKTTTVGHEQPKRRCSNLRYRALCVGLQKTPPIREEFFYLPTEEEECDDDAPECFSGQTTVRPSGGSSWLPEGEVIEEFSD